MNAANRGHDVRRTLVAKLADPDAYGAEGVAVYGIKGMGRPPIMQQRPSGLIIPAALYFVNSRRLSGAASFMPSLEVSVLDLLLRPELPDVRKSQRSAQHAFMVSM